jgi:hypothetical protein
MRGDVGGRHGDLLAAFAQRLDATVPPRLRLRR